MYGSVSVFVLCAAHVVHDNGCMCACFICILTNKKKRIQWFEATIPSERHKSIENDESRWLIWHTNSNVFFCFFVLNIIVVIHRMYTLKWLDTNKRTEREREKKTAIDNDGTQSDIYKMSSIVLCVIAIVVFIVSEMLCYCVSASGACRCDLFRWKFNKLLYDVMKIS